MSDTPETDAKAHSIFGNHSCATVLADFARKLERERDEAIRKQDETNRSSKYACDYHYEEKLKAERERDEWKKAAFEITEELERERDDTMKVLTIIHRWIERNHPDGFIDSLSFTENLERITDRWYDRLDMVERERDEARKKIKRQAERIRELEGATNHAGGLHK